jgi:stage IV sporulation protein FA
MVIHRLVQKVGKGWMGMVKSRSDEIRRRIAKRRKGMDKTGKYQERNLTFPGDDEKYGFNQIISYGGGEKEDDIHPLFKKEIFLFKILASVFMFLVIAILFRNHSTTLDPARNMVKKAMDKEFQFASVTNWYEDKFGKPLALLPFTEKKQPVEKTSAPEYSVPASGRVVENFIKNGQGVMIETGKGTQVKAINEGTVLFAGIKEGLGKTVIIQHSDKTESWYGDLGEIKVNSYEYIEKGKEVGTVSTSGGEDKTKGSYYFALKKGDNFIDPIQVIRFD